MENEGFNERLEKIFALQVELKNDMKHLTQRMDTRAEEIRELATRVSGLETRMAVNDLQTKKNSSWFDYAFKGVMALVVGYVAVRVGLK